MTRRDLCRTSALAIRCLGNQPLLWRRPAPRGYAPAMSDLTDPRAIKLKGLLFLVAGILSAGLLLAESPRWRTALLLAFCVWSFCRLYYFAFYVIERYVDPGYKFAGLGSFLRYWLRRQ